MKIKQNIPNFLTCCNLLCGCLAIQQAFQGSLVNSAYLVGIAAVFDFFDGFAARTLGVSSPIGKDLDSLADLVTFGVVPGMMMYKIISFSTEPMATFLPSSWKTDEVNFIPFIAFMIPIFSAVRLAKFNNDSRQSESFIGLPTPANAIFISSFLLIGKSETNKSFYLSDIFVSSEPLTENSVSNTFPWLIEHIAFNPYAWSIMTIVLSFLLVAPLPLFALKFKSFGWKGNEIRYVFLGLSLTLIIALKFISIPLIIILYILLSIVNNLIKKKEIPSP